MKGPLTGRHVLIAVLAFFGVVFAVNGVMTYIALDSFSGLATEDAYRKGLRYNEQLATADAQAAQGWRVKVDYREGSGSLRLTLRDKDDLPLRSLQIEGIVGRPATAQHDRQLAFVQSSPGVYEAQAGVLPVGRWLVKLYARETPESAPYRIERRLWLE